MPSKGAEDDRRGDLKTSTNGFKTAKSPQLGKLRENYTWGRSSKFYERAWQRNSSGIANEIFSSRTTVIINGF
jgi:hypothetical protein